MLYLIGTPIGNLNDLSIRAANTLLSVPVLLAEDTRSAQKLLLWAEEMLGKKRIENQKVISYYQEVEFQKLPSIIDLLEDGTDIALISEAGMPLISDPGYLLVHTAQKQRIPLTVIPGPSAVHTALVASGVKFDQYQFLGFLPKKDKEKIKLFDTLSAMQESMGKTRLVFVAFESPERVQDTLTLLYEKHPQCAVVLCRELTKHYEEIVHQPSPSTHYRGEIVLLIDYCNS